MGRNYTDALEFILDGEAESVSNGRCSNLTPSKELRHLWARWGETLFAALNIWEAQHPETLRAPMGLLLAKEQYADADVYFTLNGDGVGIWDGRWDDYFVSRGAIDDLSRFLKKVLSKAFGTIAQAIQDEAMRLCDEEKEKRPKQRGLLS